MSTNVSTSPSQSQVSGPPSVRVLVQRIDGDLALPVQSHPGDAGVDLYASQDVDLGPGQWALVPTGIAIALPEGYAAFVHPRSGLAAKHGVTTLNGPGTVDAGYRGEIKVNLINHHRDQAFRVSRGDRIAQLVLQQVLAPRFTEVDRLPGSQRGSGGHGSTGGTTAPAGTAAPAGTTAPMARQRATSSDQDQHDN